MFFRPFPKAFGVFPDSSFPGMTEDQGEHLCNTEKDSSFCRLR